MKELFNSKFLNMGKEDLSFTVGHGWHVKRKTGYLLAFLAVAACVIVGLLTYYIGVSPYKCENISPDGQDGDGDGDNNNHKQKVSRETTSDFD